jgi:hypothetical protein
MMKFFVWILLIMAPSILFGQRDSLTFVLRAMPEGAYANYEDFISKRTSINRDSVLMLVGKGSDATSIFLPEKYSHQFLAIVLSGELYINYAQQSKNVPVSGLPMAVMMAATRNYRIFVRVVKFGSIGLTSYGSCFKMSDRIKQMPITPKVIKAFIADDKALSDLFKKTRDKETEMYRFIDLYNAKHPAFR